MALSKNIKYDIRRKYYRVLQISFIISLSLLILAFKFFPDNKITVLDLPPSIGIIDVCSFSGPVVHELPPPPKPPIPIEAPTDDILDDVEIAATDLIIDAVVPPPPPPPSDVEVEPIPEFVAIAEEMPKPIGGIASIQSKIVYPQFAIRAGIKGRVYVKAFIDEKGNVFKVELQKGIGGGCDEVAMNAVKNALFSPGKQRGKPVKVQMTVPILFEIR